MGLGYKGHRLGPPTVSSWGEKRLDVFARDLTTGHLVHRWYSGTWSAWRDLAAGPGGAFAPSVASRSSGLLDVFAVDSSGNLRRYWFDGARWRGWENLGKGPGGAAYSATTAAIAPTSARMQVYGTTTTGQRLVRRWFDTSTWYGPGDLGRSPDGSGLTSVAASSWSDGRLHVISLDASTKDPVHKRFDGTRWLAPYYID